VLFCGTEHVHTIKAIRAFQIIFTAASSLKFDFSWSNSSGDSSGSGMVVHGSNDLANWTKLYDSGRKTSTSGSLKNIVVDVSQYDYFRFYSSGSSSTGGYNYQSTITITNIEM